MAWLNLWAGLESSGPRLMVRSAYRATRPLADDGIPVACDSGVREPSREIPKPWMLLVPGVRTYRTLELLLTAASSGVLPEPVFAVCPSAFNRCNAPLNATAYPEIVPLPVLVV